MAIQSMKKRLLKYGLGITLAMAPTAVGINSLKNLSYYAVQSIGYTQEKEAVIAEFQQTDEYEKGYQELLSKERNASKEDEKIFGNIPNIKEEFEEAALTEEVAITYGGDQVAQQITRLNQELGKCKDAIIKNTGTFAVTFSLLYPVACLSSKLFLSADRKPEEYIDHSYDHKPIIM